MGTRRCCKYLHINTGSQESQNFRHDERFGRRWKAQRKDANPDGLSIFRHAYDSTRESNKRIEKSGKNASGIQYQTRVKHQVTQTVSFAVGS